MATQIPSSAKPALAAAVLAALLIGLDSTWAGGEATTDTRFSQKRNNREVRSDEQQAQDWGLQAEDWLRYRQLQQGPLGVYSPNLDPLTALGIEARSDDERRRFAELQVRAESARVTKELAYQRAYDQAWKRLYPTLQVVTLTGATNSSPVQLQGNGRLALFIEEHCMACTLQVKKLQATAASSTCIWSALITTMPACGSGRSGWHSIHGACTSAGSLSITMRVDGTVWV